MSTQGCETQLRRAYRLMRAHFGHQHWWPGETAFEVCVGAILTQNTNWANVERAIANLKSAGVLAPKKLSALTSPQLAALIRPAGYFNVKARRLRAFLNVLVEYCPESDMPRARLASARGRTGASRAHLCDQCHSANAWRAPCLERLLKGDTEQVRQRLLGICGIGPETADSMLLYAGGPLSFVIDAYTKRIFTRHGWTIDRSREPTYDELKRLCESALRDKPRAALLDYWQDYHAQLVMVGKTFCRPKVALCQQCPLRPLLPRTRPHKTR
ncbi:MAG: endonuclease III domain-containing protein [Verrucomicrobiae bacterium]|nr:endonuclease III domain-containing protein [Verrucomicrobiae bacterium]